MAIRREMSIYVDEDQHDLLRQAAAFQGLSVSSWGRSVLLERARELLGAKDDPQITQITPIEGDVN